MTQYDLLMRDVAASHWLNKSLTPADRRIQMGLPRYSCECGEWASHEATSFRNHELHAALALGHERHVEVLWASGKDTEATRCRAYPCRLVIGLIDGASIGKDGEPFWAEAATT